MSFAYPLFLVAGLALAIPLIIHLFNLRRYKTVYFPHTRFLKSIQLKSQKQSQLRYKLLLSLRMLFLAALILAFAQPFFIHTDKKSANSLSIIYIDNSPSMSVKKGALTLLDIAKEAARKQVLNANPGIKFLLLTNDKPASYQPLSSNKTLAELEKISFSANGKISAEVIGMVQTMMQSEALPAANVYYYSDFQRTAFEPVKDARLMRSIYFNGIPIQAEASQNIYIDTAYLTTPILQAGQSNQLVVRTKALGKLPPEIPTLQLMVNGQVKTASSLGFDDKQESLDTLSFQVNDSRWQQITLTVNDIAVRFDDTFRIAARSTPGLSVLVLNETQPNPYISAAFRASAGFRLNQLNIAQIPDLSEYNLVILNGITRLDNATAQMLSASLQKGQSITIFPGRTNNIATLNEAFRSLGDISITGIDTSVQIVTDIQHGSPLVRDMFEKMPDNVELPTVKWHYNIDAGLTANQQSVFSFRNGDPFLASYTPSKGKLYISSSAADMQSGNFTGSYFFVPFLYQMAMQSRGSDIYAITAGKEQAIYLPMKEVSERNMVHLYAKGMDIIPPQRPAGAGLEVFVAKATEQAGFYNLAAAGADTAQIGLNEDRTESQLDVWDINTLKSQWKSDQVNWIDNTQTADSNGMRHISNFPLWKVCAILALLMLAAETIVLAGGFRKQNTVTT